MCGGGGAEVEQAGLGSGVGAKARVRYWIGCRTQGTWARPRISAPTERPKPTQAIPHPDVPHAHGNLHFTAYSTTPYPPHTPTTRHIPSCTPITPPSQPHDPTVPYVHLRAPCAPYGPPTASYNAPHNPGSGAGKGSQTITKNNSMLRGVATNPGASVVICDLFPPIQVPYPLFRVTTLSTQRCMVGSTFQSRAVLMQCKQARTSHHWTAILSETL